MTLQQKSIPEVKAIVSTFQDGQIENLKADYLSVNLGSLSLAPNLKRVHVAGQRYYFTLGTSEPQFYMGTTEVVEKVLPARSKKDPLLEWYMETFGSIQEARDYIRTKAQYATLMKTVFSIYYRESGINVLDIKAVLRDFLKRENIPHHLYFDRWLQDLCVDLASFEAFLIQHEVSPLGISVPLHHPGGYATQIYFPCEMTVFEKGYHGEVYKTGNAAKGITAGDPKETVGPVKIRAIIDFKAKRDCPFREEQELKLILERMIWNHWMDDHGLSIERVFMWSPSDWKASGEPSFKLSEKTHTKEADCLTDYLNIARKKGLTTYSKTWVDFIEMKVGKATQFKTYDLSEYVKLKSISI